MFHAILEDDSDGTSSDDEDSEGQGDEPNQGDEDPEGTSSSRESYEGDGQAPAEIFAQEHRAKKRVNELKQMRQFFQKGTSNDHTRAWVKGAAEN